MRITIAERLKPFSHIPGTYFILPCSSLRVQIFPTLIRIDDLSEKNIKPHQEIPLKIQGPVEGFTIQQDLEKNNLRVWGSTSKGFIRYRLEALDPSNFSVTVEKEDKELLSIPETPKKPSKTSVNERLSLGVSKAQDWTMIRRRCEMAEIFPFWHRLGQLLPKKGKVSQEQSLFEECRLAVQKESRDRLLVPFYNLFLAGFEGGLSPRLEDSDFQGFTLPIIPAKTPLALLSNGADLIRSLFLQCAPNPVISILPALPSQFHSGRMTGAHCENWGCLDMEWSKKKIRRAVFKAASSGDINFEFQKEIKSFRLRKGNRDRGHRYFTKKSITIEADHIYWFDNFEQ